MITGITAITLIAFLITKELAGAMDSKRAHLIATVVIVPIIPLLVFFVVLVVLKVVEIAS